jgi:hypothetical protein
MLTASLLCLAALAAPALARVNSTGALETFWISDCSLCTNGQRDSIFCTAASSDSDWVKNETTTFTVAMKKQAPPAGLGPGDGAKYCWSGTFGGLLNNNGGPYNILGSSNVTARLNCDSNNLFYRQCYSAWRGSGAARLARAAAARRLQREPPRTPFFSPRRISLVLSQSPCSWPSSSCPSAPSCACAAARAWAFAAAAASA